MAKSKSESGTVKKASARRPRKAVAKRKTPVRKATQTRKTRAPRTPDPVAPPSQTSISEAQSNVVASKFRTEGQPPSPAPLPTLPSSYGESHLLLLVRDPQTLFAAWDVSPSTVDAMKARMGARGYAVSNLTLRLTRAGGGATTFHLGKKVRTRYLKIDGGPSYIAEIGITPPSGRFELIARSAPCFVPQGASAHLDWPGTRRRAVLGYREARALAQRGLVPVNPDGTPRKRTAPSPSSGGGAGASVSAAHAGAAAPRVLGGASDLYRR